MTALGIDRSTYRDPVWRAAHLTEYWAWKKRAKVIGTANVRPVAGWRLLDESGTRMELMWPDGSIKERVAAEPFPLHICREIEWPPVLTGGET